MRSANRRTTWQLGNLAMAVGRHGQTDDGGGTLHRHKHKRSTTEQRYRDQTAVYKLDWIPKLDWNILESAIHLQW